MWHLKLNIPRHRLVISLALSVFLAFLCLSISLSLCLPISPSFYLVSSFSPLCSALSCEEDMHHMAVETGSKRLLGEELSRATRLHAPVLGSNRNFKPFDCSV